MTGLPPRRPARSTPDFTKALPLCRPCTTARPGRRPAKAWRNAPPPGTNPLDGARSSTTVHGVRLTLPVERTGTPPQPPGASGSRTQALSPVGVQSRTLPAHQGLQDRPDLARSPSPRPREESHPEPGGAERVRGRRCPGGAVLGWRGTVTGFLWWGRSSVEFGEVVGGASVPLDHEEGGVVAGAPAAFPLQGVGE